MNTTTEAAAGGGDLAVWVRTEPKLQEKVYGRRLPNGMELFVWPKPGFTKKFAALATHYGSIDSHFYPPGSNEAVHVPDGIAHFLEHKMFEEENGSVFERFAKLGASANAYTNYNQTTYIFSCTDRFEENLRILIDFVFHPYFTDQNVEKEKGIIAQELKMYRDEPAQEVYRHLLEALYHENPVRLEIGGTVESIQKITKEDLYTCYNTFYHPSNMVLVAAGDLDPEATLDLAAQEILARRPRVQGEIRRLYPSEPKGVRESRHEETLVAAQPILYLGFKDGQVGLTGEPLLRREVATAYVLHLLLGRSSSLYNQLYEEGLINDDFGTAYIASPQYAHIIIGGETRDPKRLEQRIWEGIHAFVAQGIAPADFARVRRRWLGHSVLQFDSVEYIANRCASLHFEGVNLLDYPEIVSRVTLEEVASRLKDAFVPEQAAASIVWPQAASGRKV